MHATWISGLHRFMQVLYKSHHTAATHLGNRRMNPPKKEIRKGSSPTFLRIPRSQSSNHQSISIVRSPMNRRNLTQVWRAPHDLQALNDTCSTALLLVSSLHVPSLSASAEGSCHMARDRDRPVDPPTDQIGQSFAAKWWTRLERTWWVTTHPHILHCFSHTSLRLEATEIRLEPIAIGWRP